MINGFVDLTTAGWVHTVLASVGILVGAEQLIRTRRDWWHRQLGYVYVASMVVADLSILTVYRFNGRFNAFHVGAIVNLFCLAMALRPMLAKPRPVQWRLTHYMWVSWSYVGLLAAALTEFLIRTRPFGVGAAPIAATVGASLVVGVVGAVLIQRFRPNPVRTTAGVK
jgi:uncharacterized membrane protein